MTYKEDKKYAKKSLKSYINFAFKNYGWFVKSSWYLEKVCYLLMVVLGCWNIWYAIFKEKEPLFFLFLIMTVGFPYGISFIFVAVYKYWVGKEYIFRQKQSLKITKDKIVYSYDMFTSTSRIKAEFLVSNIKEIQIANGEVKIIGNGLFTFNNETKEIDNTSFLSVFGEKAEKALEEISFQRGG